MMSYLYKIIRPIKKLFKRELVSSGYLKNSKEVKLYLGCGANHQDGYLNIDNRYTKGADIVASIKWCQKKFLGKCDEIYISHILEHFGQPGKRMERGNGSVLGFLDIMNSMLKPTGVLRIAVPDFEAISELYFKKKISLYPRLVGRLCGEQDYKGNTHKCIFDKDFLIFCLKNTGFTDCKEWDPKKEGFQYDSSFDEIDGVRTSLNILARKKL